MGDHRKIHSPEFQRGHHVPTFRPACYVAEGGPAPWPCGAAETPELWAVLTTHSFGCGGCAKSRLASDIYWGVK
jgi:hypothetical protein